MMMMMMKEPTVYVHEDSEYAISKVWLRRYKKKEEKKKK